MGFTTKEFCKICNVGRETLRHYEQLGFLHPKTNPDNHYRSYDGWDAGMIAEIKRYQSLGFSLEQIKAMLSGYSLSALTASMKERIDIYHSRVRYYQMLCQKGEEELWILRHVPQLLDHYTVSQMPSLHYIPDKDLIQAPFVNQAIKYLDFFIPCICVDRDFSGDETKSDYSGWGVVAKKEYSDYLEVKDGITIPSSETICTIIDAGEKGSVTKTLFDAFYSYVKQNGFNPHPTIYACLLARTHDSTGDYHRYLYTFCPIQSKSFI